MSSSKFREMNETVDQIKIKYLEKEQESEKIRKEYQILKESSD